MRILSKVFQLFVVLVLVSGCSGVWEPEVQATDIAPDQSLSSTSSLRQVYIRNDQSNYMTCTQPQPDTAFNQGSEADLSIALISLGDDGAGEQESTTEVEMAGRTPAVMMARELFFRACEFSQNYKLSKDEALTLYNKTLDLVGQGWSTEGANTTVSIGDTVTATGTTSVTASETGSITQTDTITDTTTDSTSATITQ